MKGREQMPGTKTKNYREIERELLADPESRANIERELALMRAGLALSRAREKAGLTQADVAKALGISQGRVSRLERAENVQLSTLVRYAEALGGELEVTFRLGDESVDLTPAREAAHA
jgi:DNA-binding XRE family transcriptional regulator